MVKASRSGEYEGNVDRGEADAQLDGLLEFILMLEGLDGI